MTYRFRLGISLAVLVASTLATLAWAVLFVDLSAFRVMPAAELCRSAPRSAPTMSGLADIASTNFVVLAHLVAGGLLFWIRSFAQLVALGIDFGRLLVASTLATDSALFPFAGVVPHGFAELAAFVAGGATGLGVAEVVVRIIIRREAVDYRVDILRLLREMRVPVVLLALAAAAEEAITGPLLDWVLGC